VSKAQGQFRNPEEGEHLLLEAGAGGLVKSRHTEKTRRML
jgi:hypothetical protein